MERRRDEQDQPLDAALDEPVSRRRVGPEPAVVQPREDGRDESQRLAARCRMLVTCASQQVAELGMQRLRVEAVAMAPGDRRHARTEAAHDDRRRRIGPKEAGFAAPQPPHQRDRVDHALRADSVGVDVLTDGRLLRRVRRASIAARAEAEQQSPAGDGLQRRRHAGEHAGHAIGDVEDERAERDAPGDLRERRQHRPRLGHAGHAVTALAIDAGAAWAIIAGSSLWELRERAWRRRTALEGPRATCLAPARDGLLVGTEQAHLLRVTDAGVARIEAFETVEGREGWYTPWGDPADVRSIAVARDCAIHVNVHVGGVARSRDGGTSWTPTIDIEQDVHQVTAHPREPEIVVVASAEGFGISRNGGDSWSFVTAGLHAHYCRAVAVAGDHVLVSAATGFRGRRSAIYRAS